MADSPPDDGAARSDDTAKLELPSLNPFKRRRARREPEPVEPLEATEPGRGPEAAAERYGRVRYSLYEIRYPLYAELPAPSRRQTL